MDHEPAQVPPVRSVGPLGRGPEPSLRAADTPSTGEACFERVMTAAGHGTWSWDGRAGEIRLGPSCWTMLGCPPGEFPADNRFWLGLIHPDDREHAERAFREALAGEADALHAEFRVKHRHGRWIRARAEGVLVERGGGGEAPRMIGFLEDMSRWEEAKDELKLVQSVLERAPTGCVQFGRDGRISYANRQACRALGYGRDELLNTCMADIACDLEPGAWEEIWKRLEETGASSFEVYCRRKDGTQFPAEVRIDYAELSSGGCGCAWLDDLSDRKQAEQALRENEERLRQAVRVSGIGIFDYDHLTDTLYWSPRQREICGLDADEPVTLPGVYQLIPPEDIDDFLAATQRASDPSGDGLWDVEHRVLRRDGTVRWVKARAQTFFEGEGAERRPARTVGAERDVTDERRRASEWNKLQAQLVQAQKMESVGRLAGGVAHDFNNMLSVILGHAGLLLADLDPASPFRADLEEIDTAARRSADLTRQLLTFARRQSVAPRVLDLNDTIDGMLKMLRRLIGENIEVAWVPGDGLWPVRIDPTQIDQILVNLLVNARDAITGSGRITIETHRVELDDAYCAANAEAIPGQFTQLVVGDDGHGMDKEVLRHAFEPFYTTKRQGKGTGLGLATVYGIVQQNEGFLSVRSELGQGTTFKIHLPRYAEAVATEAPGTPKPSSTDGTETILIVEDDPLVLRLILRLLRGLGYTVLPASTPTEAFNVAEEHTEGIQLLLTDVVMPEMNGRDLAKALTDRLPGLKCLFMSGYTASVVSRRGMLEEGVHFLQKPLLKEQLAVKVREVLDSD